LFHYQIHIKINVRRRFIIADVSCAQQPRCRSLRDGRRAAAPWPASWGSGKGGSSRQSGCRLLQVTVSGCGTVSQVVQWGPPFSCLVLPTRCVTLTHIDADLTFRGNSPFSGMIAPDPRGPAPASAFPRQVSLRRLAGDAGAVSTHPRKSMPSLSSSPAGRDNVPRLSGARFETARRKSGEVRQPRNTGPCNDGFVLADRRAITAALHTRQRYSNVGASSSTPHAGGVAHRRRTTEGVGREYAVK
jgi:hypothetical protein